jgi:hypothetical protein
MTCYVDELREAKRSPRWPYNLVSHLACDSTEELDAFAASLGLLTPNWRQKSGTHREHYDLNKPRWKAAIAAGAKRLNAREMSAFMSAKRVKD